MKTVIIAMLCGLLLSSRFASAEEGDDPLENSKAASERYKFPKGADSDALIEYCQQLQEYEPEDDADAELHEKKMPKAIKKACKRILELEKNEESDQARYARRFLLAEKLDTAGELDAPKMDKLLEKVRTFLISPKANGEDADVASALADFLGDRASPKSIEWSRKVGQELAAHKDHDLAAAGKILLGTARRLSLIGKPLALKGTTLDGKAFDITSLKDKVVLVVFWASWCAHCQDEIPIMKENYGAYHSKGFEVVAISADDDRGELDEFIKLERIPWINLYEKDGKHPAMDELGINGFPSTLMVGKDGKVALLNVRDKALGDQLKKLLGEPVAGNETPEPKKKEPSRKKEPKKDPAPEKDDPQGSDSIEELKKKFTF